MSSPKPPPKPESTVPHTVRNTIPLPSLTGNPNSIAAQYARAKALQDARDQKDREKVAGLLKDAGLGDGTAGGGVLGKKKSVVERLSERKVVRWKGEWSWVAAFFCWVL